MADLIPPHGGLTEPVCRTVADGRHRRRSRPRRPTLPQIPVSAADLSSVYRFGDGTLSPLTGPMDSETYHRVLDEAVITIMATNTPGRFRLRSRSRPTWPRRCKEGQKAALVGPDGNVAATLTISDVYPWPKLKYLRQVYLTDRLDHPGADMVIQGRCGQFASRRRRTPGAAAAEECEVRQVRADAARSPQVPRRQGLGSRRSRSRPATRCTGRMNTRWFTAWRR